MLRSFHEGMQAEVRVKDMTTDTIEVMNGLRQCNVHWPLPSLTSITVLWAPVGGTVACLLELM